MEVGALTVIVTSSIPVRLPAGQFPVAVFVVVLNTYVPTKVGVKTNGILVVLFHGPPVIWPVPEGPLIISHFSMLLALPSRLLVNSLLPPKHIEKFSPASTPAKLLTLTEYVRLPPSPHGFLAKTDIG